MKLLFIFALCLIGIFLATIDATVADTPTSVPTTAASSQALAPNASGDMVKDARRWTPQQRNHFIKSARSEDHKIETGTIAKQLGFSLIRETPAINDQWLVTITVARRTDKRFTLASVLSEDTVTATEGAWNIIEVEGHRRFVFLISKTSDPTRNFLSWNMDYLLDDGGAFWLGGGRYHEFSSAKTSISIPVFSVGFDGEIPLVTFSARRLASPAPTSKPVTVTATGENMAKPVP